MKKAETLYEFKHNFYSKLYMAMEKKNKTYKDLSNDLGKNSEYISRIMSGKIEPSFSMIPKGKNDIEVALAWAECAISIWCGNSSN